MHNKILINAGFYLLLLFAFAITIFPVVAFVLAATIFAIWLLDALIFRDLKLDNLPLFYPILSFNLFLLIAWFLSWVYGVEFHLSYVGLLSLFYFIVPGFVITGEQRRMVLWTFIAGAILTASQQLILWWGTAPGLISKLSAVPQPMLFSLCIAFCIVLAFYAESARLKDKLFFLLVSIPLILSIIFSQDKSMTLLFLLAIVVIGLLIDRTIIIIVGIALLIFFADFLDIRYFIDQNLHPTQYGAYVLKPIDEIITNKEIILHPGFYGSKLSKTVSYNISDSSHDSYFIKLIKEAGPLAVILFLWILFERTGESYFKRRRVTAPKIKAYHLTVLLLIGAILIGNLYNSVFSYPSIILTSWMIMGVSDV